jgi:hypothetical protein
MYEGMNSIAFFWPNKWAHLLKSNNINGGGSSKSEKKRRRLQERSQWPVFLKRMLSIVFKKSL